MLTYKNMTADYIGDETFEAFGFSQTVVSGSTVYIAGTAALKNIDGALEVVGSGDMAAQLAFILGAIGRSLSQVGATPADLTAWNLYTTDIDALMALMGTVTAWLGTSRPTSTTVEVSRLVHPELMLEISAVAEM
ncbi:MAG: hypothetical protein JWM12_1789 [Ilumatobacteraceae bacterium]|jgi:2-iminobutanoate/2-iminopropanoate deaminase|nr:hypothetical protein [Ilumatobacteraceae bacterium]